MNPKAKTILGWINTDKTALLEARARCLSCLPQDEADHMARVNKLTTRIRTNQAELERVLGEPKITLTPEADL